MPELQSVEELQSILAAKIAKLDEERKKNAERAAKEREQMLLDIEIERKKRIDEYQTKIEAREKERRDREAAEEARRQSQIAERIAMEQKQNALDETLRIQKEKLEWLEKAIADAEFVEEQHKKAIESQSLKPINDFSESVEVNVEHPTAPLNQQEPGGAVAGTDGQTPDTPAMSTHLRHILRQAKREY